MCCQMFSNLTWQCAGFYFSHHLKHPRDEAEEEIWRTGEALAQLWSILFCGRLSLALLRSTSLPSNKDTTQTSKNKIACYFWFLFCGPIQMCLTENSCNSPPLSPPPAVEISELLPEASISVCLIEGPALILQQAFKNPLHVKLLDCFLSCNGLKVKFELVLTFASQSSLRFSACPQTKTILYSMSLSFAWRNYLTYFRHHFPFKLRQLKLWVLISIVCEWLYKHFF